MATVTRWSVAVALAAAIALGGPAAWAADIILQDGTRAIIDDNSRVFFLTPAKDGTYKTKDGGSILVQKGIVVQRPGAKGSEKGIILQQPAPAAAPQK